MKSVRVYFWLVLSITIVGSHALSGRFHYIGQNNAVSNQTAAAYSLGVYKGIINPEKYSLESFDRDERNVFKDLYKDYTSLNRSQSINYHEWLIMNNFGILPDTQESLLQKKIITTRYRSDNKMRFITTVRKGDILITGRGIGGLVGHAAIMTTNYWVLEMPGGRGWEQGIKDNNRQISKEKWYDEHDSDWTTVYRCLDSNVAHQAAVWADRNYFNPSGGSRKTKHITYKITTNFKKTCPSYSSKLVLQAYYFGPGSKNVVREVSDAVIIPSSIPAYFLPPYTLRNRGKF